MDKPQHATEYGSAPLPPATFQTTNYRKWWIITTALGFSGAAFAYTSSSNALSFNFTTLSKYRTHTIQMWQTSYTDGQMSFMQAMPDLEATTKAKKYGSKNSITIDEKETSQEILGFGGAFTEAASLQFAAISPDLQQEFLKLYFDNETGLGYTLGRVPMGSSDFSMGSYSFAEEKCNASLDTFDMHVTHDTTTKIPFLQAVLKLVPDLKLFLAPWSPPAWMKRADPKTGYVPSMTGSALPVGLKSEDRDAWAEYFSKFLTAYQSYGIKFHWASPQNEPEFPAPWDACAYTPSYEVEFIEKFLGPKLAADHPDVGILLFDHNRDHMVDWTTTLMNSPEAAKYVDGIAFHWYNARSRETDGIGYHFNLDKTHDVAPSKFLLATEACSCPFVSSSDEQRWFRAKRYGHDIIADLNHFVSGWVDWNLLLDSTGGPNHLKNFCDGPILLDDTKTKLDIQPMYYFIQHFSKFIPPGSIHIQADIHMKKFMSPDTDPQLFPFFPVSYDRCDSSSRQKIVRSEDSKLQINGTMFCIDMMEQPNINGTMMKEIGIVDCRYTQQSWSFNESNGQISMNDYCLSARGSKQSLYGSNMIVEKCLNGASEQDEEIIQQWYMDSKTLEMHPKSLYDDKQTKKTCVTAGYTFLQAAAFQTPNKETVLVVLNENTVDAEFQIAMKHEKLSVKTTIPAGAIQTYVW